MSRAAPIKKWGPGLVAAVAVALLALGVSLTWKTLAGSAPGPSAESPAPDGGVRISTDPAAAERRPAANAASAQLPSMQQGAKPPSAFGLPQFADAFDFHSMEAKAASGRSPIGSSAFLSRKARAADIAQFYLLELGKDGWELVWQRDAKIHPNNDKTRAPITGTRLRWLHTTRRQQLTLLALDDPQKQHTAQAVVSWATLPGSRPGGKGG